jgi:hypothetical protein
MVDWQRIVSIELRPLAWKIAKAWGADVEDVHADLVLAIAEHAAINPAYLEQTNAYVTTWARWRVSDAYRKGKAITSSEFDDETIAWEEPHRPTFDDLELAVKALPESLRAIAEAILAAPGPGQLLIGERWGKGARLNVAAVSRAIGYSESWTRTLVKRIRRYGYEQVQA